MRFDEAEGKIGIFLVTMIGMSSTFEMPLMNRGKTTSGYYEEPPEMLVLVQVTLEHPYFDLCTGEIYRIGDRCFEPTGERITQEMLIGWFNEECRKRIDAVGEYAAAESKRYRNRKMSP